MDDLLEDTPFIIVDTTEWVMYQERHGNYIRIRDSDLDCAADQLNWYGNYDQSIPRYGYYSQVLPYDSDLVALLGGGMIGAQDGIEPEYTPETGVPSDAPERIAMHDRGQCRAAAAWAKKAFPGAIGEFLAQEIGWTAEMGYSIAPGALMDRVIDQVLKTQMHGPSNG